MGVFPGLVKSSLFQASTGAPWGLRMAGFFARFFGLTVEEAAQVPRVCATNEDVARLRGGAFGPKMAKRTLAPSCADPRRQDQPWDASEGLVARWLPA